MTGKIRQYAAYLSAGLVAVSLLYLATIYCICYLAPGYGLFDDDGIYLVTAKSLAEGTGYTIISLPTAIPQTKYPPIFPALLAGIWKIYPHFPQNALALRLIPFSSMLCWLWFSYLILQRMSLSPSVCRCIILLSAALPWVVCLSVTFMAEMTFACLLSAAVLMLMRLEKEETSRTRTLLFASAVTATAILTRTAGLPLLLAGALTFLFRRRVVQAFIYLLTTGIALLPWFFWASHSHPAPNSVESYYSGGVYGTWSLVGNFTWHQRVTVVLENFFYMLVSPGYFVAGFARPAGWEAVPWILLVLLLGFFSLYGFLLYVSWGITPLNLFILCYAALLLVWVFPPFRFLIPLFPFILFFCYIAIRHFFGTVVGSPLGTKVVGLCCVIVLALVLIRGLFIEARETIQYRAASLPFRNSYDWNEIMTLSQWIAGNTSEDAVFSGDLDTVWFLSTGRKSARGYVINPFEISYSSKPQNPLGSYSEFAQNLILERADYLIRTHGGGAELNTMIDRLASEYSNAVSLQEQAQDSDYRIYQIDRSRLEDDLASGSPRAAFKK